MKKALRNKLQLKKYTVANLTNIDMYKIKGGTTVFDTCYCYSEHKSCTLGGNCCPPVEKADNDTFNAC